MSNTTVTLSQGSNGQVTSVGDFLLPVRKSQIYQNVQIVCSDGRLLENQLAVGLIFYQLIKDINSDGFPDFVLIMLDHTVQEVTAMFSGLYSQKFKDVTDLKELVKYNHKDSIEDLVVKEEYSDDDDSKQLFDEDYVNIQNIKEDAIELSCDFCHFKSNHSGRLKTHTERMHNVNKNLGAFKCEDCKFTCNANSNLLRHKKTQCTQKLESCLFCDKKYLTKSSVRKHRERYHKQEWKEFKEGKKSINGQKVSESQKLISISEKSKLKLERRKAQGRVKVACEICAQLVAKDHLKKHLYNIHQQGSVKKAQHIYPKIPCPHCEQKVSSWSIRNHLRVAHKMTGGLGSIEVECVYCLNQIAITSFQHHVRNTCFARTGRTDGVAGQST